MARTRILLVEDEALIALHLEDLLREGGHAVVGPANSLDAAVALARAEALDAAVLNVSLAGVAAWPVADELLVRGIPFLFLTGFGSALPVPAACQHAPRLAKPCRSETLLGAVGMLLESSRAP